jgi:mannosylglycerate hydrolase
MKKKVHVVPHSHWDREWYFTTSRSKIYLMNNFQKVLSLLEENNGYNYYVLDGQASLLDDYLSWKPEDKERIGKLVKDGKLIVGPWYTQTDQMLISGESIVRNMQYGMEISDKFGKYMNIGYVPDSFGQSAAMPQIYKEFGIEDTLFWRGVSDDDVKHTEYTWKGEDGSCVNVYQIPSGYYIGGEIPEDPKHLSNFLLEEPFNKLWSRSTTENVLLPNGFDQAPPRENLPELITHMNHNYEDLEFEVSNFQNYIDSVKSHHPELEQISGELLNGKLMRIHKSIFSSRSDLKGLNTKIQSYLVNTLEPILSISYSLGFEYPTEVIKEIWKLMFENAAHDSIGSCVSDTTNEDVYFRYKRANDLAENLVELKLREISTRIDNQEDITITAFNTTSSSKSGIFETSLYVPSLDFSIKDSEGKPYDFTILRYEDQTHYILGQGNILDPSKKYYKPQTVYKVDIACELENIPSFGYQQFHIDLHASSLKKLTKSSDSFIENEFYKIELNNSNTIDILDKKTNFVYKNQAIIEENGDDGDSFNYSPPKKDQVIRSSDFAPKVKVSTSSIMSMIKLEYNLLVPKNLEERKAGKVSVSLPVTLRVTLKKNTPFIDFKFTVNNQNIDSHRMCVLFDSKISSNFSFADQQFGIIKRPVIREKELKLWKANPESWNEVPISIETCQSFVSLENDDRGVALIPRGVREYEIVGESYDTITLTLFRSYGFMGKEDLLYRPGRASGETVISTPDAQLHKELTFDFSAIYYQGNLSTYHLSHKVNEYLKDINLYQEAEYLNTRLKFTQTSPSKSLPLVYSLFNAQGNGVLSIVKKAESRPGFIIRFYNGKYKQNDKIRLFFNKDIKVAELVNLKEEKKLSLKPTNELRLPELGHAKLLTVYIELKK